VITPLLLAPDTVESIPTLSTAGLATLGVLLVLLTAWRPSLATRARRRID
jgi:hypothetical protein